MSDPPHASDTILIAGITPYFLERDVLWFGEHAAEIEKKARGDSWWHEHTTFVEAGMRLPYSPFLRKLADLGYAKAGEARYRGEFASHGGIVDVFPINLKEPVRIEFSGNIIERIIQLPLDEESSPSQLFKKKSWEGKPKNPTEYERLWLSGLRSGDYVVHADHGIGVFRGYVPAMTNENTAIDRGREFYVLEYAPPRKGGMPDKLSVPRAQSLKLSRYIGFETPAIHRLGGTAWESTKRKAREDTKKLAEELSALYRERARVIRPAYPRHDDIERHLAHSFPYEETEDQRRAIADIHEDLSRERPMDRLLVGDVGFGKTEVALRAAARAAYSGRQVALVAPTTILADQHFGTFCERLKGLPIEIAMLTRLTPQRGAKRITHAISAGTIDIVIGTHRLLSRDIAWRDLGLVIIDEEQRFGVRQKEHFKKLRAAVDILSLSATPIPRTLSLALSKFRDLSMITAPPSGRLPIKTFVLPYAEQIVREAIAAERERNGQIFYLWNRIESIEAVRRDIERLAPGARIAILHGRMREQDLIRTMHEFDAGKIDILVATTIIENGLDLPNANTLIVANAGRLGLSQAYQIRGRIGRGNTPAYAYLLYPVRSRTPQASAVPHRAERASNGVYPAHAVLTEKAKLRLQALKELEDLGSGFQIALKDLEIRGAGNVLGRQQSGAANRVGLNLYAQLLGEALEEFNTP